MESSNGKNVSWEEFVRGCQGRDLTQFWHHWHPSWLLFWSQLLVFSVYTVFLSPFQVFSLHFQHKVFVKYFVFLLWYRLPLHTPFCRDHHSKRSISSQPLYEHMTKGWPILAPVPSVQWLVQNVGVCFQHGQHGSSMWFHSRIRGDSASLFLVDHELWDSFSFTSWRKSCLWQETLMSARIEEGRQTEPRDEESGNSEHTVLCLASTCAWISQLLKPINYCIKKCELYLSIL